MSDKTTTNSKWSSSREILTPYPDISTYLLSCTFRWVLDNIYTFAFIYLFNYVYFNGISDNGDYITVRYIVSIDMSCGLMYEYFSPHECVDSCIDYFIRRDTCSDDAGVNVQDNSF